MPTFLANCCLTGEVRGSQRLGGSGHIHCSSLLVFSCGMAKVNTPWVFWGGTFVLLKLYLWSYQTHVLFPTSPTTLQNQWSIRQVYSWKVHSLTQADSPSPSLQRQHDWQSEPLLRTAPCIGKHVFDSCKEHDRSPLARSTNFGNS